MAAKAASLALSMRRGLPPAVMYKNPAQARKSAAAARPTFMATSSSASNSVMIGWGLVIESPFGFECGTSRSSPAHPADTVEVGAPEAAEHRLNGNHLAFCGRIDL